MPIQAQSADGMVHEFPDGTAPEVIDGAMKQYAGSLKKEPAPDATNFMQRVGAGVMKPVEGLARIGEHIGIPGAQTVANSIADHRAAYNAMRGDEAGKFSGAELAGEVGATLPLAMAMPAGSTIPRMMLSGAGQGAIQGGLDAAATAKPDQFWTDTAQGAGIGAATGAGTAGAIGGLSRLVSPNVSPEVQALLDEGVTPTPGQLMGKGGRTIEKITEHVPLVGNMPISAEQRTLGQYNIATANQVLKPLGEKLAETVKPGNEAVEATKGILNRAFDDAYSRLSARATPEFVQAIGSIGGDVPDSMAKEFGKRVTAQFGSLNPSEEMSGRTLSAARKYFEDLAVKYGRDPGAEQQMLGAAYSKVAGAIDDMVSAAHPEETGLQAAKAAWRQFLPFRSAAAKDVAEGVFSPAQLAASVRQFGGTDATARGVSPLQDWAAAGLKVMGPNAPRSQSVTSTMLGGAGAMYALPHLLQPGVAIPALGVGAMYSPIGQRLTAAALTQRPAYAKAVADALRASSPYAVNVGASGVNAR